MVRGVNMNDKFKLCIKLDTGEYLRYGSGNMLYIQQLLSNYLYRHQKANLGTVEFKIERL